MPDTFTPDQFGQTQTVPPVSGDAPRARNSKKQKSGVRRPNSRRTDRDGNISQPYSPKKSIDTWAPFIAAHLKSAQESSEAAAVSGHLLHNLITSAEFAGTRRGQELKIQTQYITRHIYEVQSYAVNAAKCLEVLCNGGWSGPSLERGRIIPRHTDPVEDRHQEYRAAEAAVNAPEHTADESPEIDAYHAAHDRFIAEPVNSLLGVLLKLEDLVEHEDFEGELQKAPQLIPPRIVLGLIKDLRAVLGRTE